jgi:small subunit ribosomal protein S6
MFLFDNTTMHQWSDIEAEVRRLIDRIQAELLVCVKFDERKLAYEIKGRKRGTYVLTYFDAEPDRITDLERDVRLSEVVLRVLVLRAEKLTEERLAELKALPADQPLQPMAGDGRRGDGPPYRGRHEGAPPRRDAPPKAEPAQETAVADKAETKPESAPVSTAEAAPVEPPAAEPPASAPADG